MGGGEKERAHIRLECSGVSGSGVLSEAKASVLIS